MDKYLFTGILIASLMSMVNYRTPTTPNAIPPATPSIGQQIKLARIQKGFSQKFLARMTGLQYEDLIAIEKEGAMPTLNTLYKIQETLGGSIVVDGDALAQR